MSSKRTTCDESTVELHIGQIDSNDKIFNNSLQMAGNWQFGQTVRSCLTMWRPVAMQNGILFRQLWQLSSVSIRSVSQKGQGVYIWSVSDDSSALNWAPADLRTNVSIFFLNFMSICSLYSAFIRVVANSRDFFLSPALWHSITADVSIGTISKSFKTNIYET